MHNNYYPFVNLPLPYCDDALEPFIDEKTMQLHHNKHLQTYIDNLNDVLKDNPPLQRMSLEQLIQNAKRLPVKLGTTIRNNAGGVYNHRFFFQGLINPSPKEPCGRLRGQITQQFGGYEMFQEEFKKSALSVFGSGYVWLAYEKGKLKITTTSNQNSPIEQGICPLITLDVWEHAYYLKHYNKRADYIEDWFCVVNWEKAEQLFVDHLYR